MACDDDVLRLQTRIEGLSARDHLLVTGVNPASEFLEELRIQEG
jgi:hypothetical protein